MNEAISGGFVLGANGDVSGSTKMIRYYIDLFGDNVKQEQNLNLYQVYTNLKLFRYNIPINQ